MRYIVVTSNETGNARPPVKRFKQITLRTVQSNRSFNLAATAVAYTFGLLPAESAKAQ